MGSGFNQTHKQRSLAELAALVPDGASIALGGSFLHRGPVSYTHLVGGQGAGMQRPRR